MEVPCHRPGLRLRSARHRPGLRPAGLSAHDGDGWVTCALGHRHWGRYGAAGLLVRTADAVVLQHRAPWSHQGDTWGLPGGARDSHETPIEAALREAAEEAAIDARDVLVTGTHPVDHGGWSYTTVLAEPLTELRPRSANPESVDVRWHPLTAVDDLPLHVGFAASWPALRAMWPVTVVVVDAANVMGARPERRWWADRARAAGTLYAKVRDWADRGVPGPRLPGPGPALRLPRVVYVVEGAARAAELPPDPRLIVVRADASGDDALVAAVRRTPNAVVVTADRELGERVTALGAVVRGPRWLLDQLHPDG